MVTFPEPLVPGQQLRTTDPREEEDGEKREGRKKGEKESERDEGKRGERSGGDSKEEEEEIWTGNKEGRKWREKLYRRRIKERVGEVRGKRKEMGEAERDEGERGEWRGGRRGGGYLSCGLGSRDFMFRHAES